MSTGDRRIRVLIADDHTLFREGIAEILAREKDLEVAGEADSGRGLLAIARKIHPDAIIVDVEMPGPGAEATVREIVSELPDTRVIILTMHDDPGLVEKMLAAGARAYVIKGATREALLAAVRGARHDDQHVVVSVSRETVIRLREPPESPLSPRELEVLTAVSAGLSNAQIAARLFITEGTVKRHLTNVYVKLDVTTRMNAINKAIEMGLIKPRGFRHPKHY
ncbi:response regulator transcription factor [Actinoallomurus sp. CA-142502]|uniref:DNA-binding response regulator n=1 Tax=Actinoallomurus iriomotensis TaxID=478107 RepID=A0A9W6S2C6_9ACTN|nr:DNA-binding response regulator [Actinoallomurus iriomotensis]GLY84362.1 DNA-binding response regulator [Actinoallomurus iriomotensis]